MIIFTTTHSTLPVISPWPLSTLYLFFFFLVTHWIWLVLLICVLTGASHWSMVNHVHVGMLVGLLLYRSCAVSHSCCEFLSPLVLSCHFSSTWLLAFFCSYFWDVPWALGVWERRGGDADVLFMAEHLTGCESVLTTTHCKRSCSGEDRESY